MTIGIIAFATSEPYRKMACEMAQSARAFAHPIKLRFPAHLWDCPWADAVCWKPQFILDELCDTSLDGLIYTDADSKVLRRPPVEELAGADIAYHVFKRTPTSPEEILTGTMFFRKNPWTISLLEAWVERTRLHAASFTPEQDSLKELVPKVVQVCTAIKRLDPEWCFIYDDMRAMYPNAQPIFEHYQASRRFRHARAEA